MSKEIFDPEWGNPSLRTIMETEFPEPISLIPATPGWWLLLLLVVGLIIRAIRQRRLRYLRDRYRRDALEQLAAIKARLNSGAVEAARELAPLLRATAIAAVDRETFSELEGDAYAAALAELSPEQDRLPVDEFKRLAYAPLDDAEPSDIEQLISVLEKWIQQHRRRHA